MRVEFGTDTGWDLLETMFGRLGGYTLGISLAGGPSVDSRLVEVGPEGRWSLLIQSLDRDGQAAESPYEINIDDIDELTIY